MNRIINGSISVPAGAYRELYTYGKMLTLFSVSTTTIQVSLDGEPQSSWREGQAMELPSGEHFRVVKFDNTGGAAVCDIEYAISEDRVSDNRAVVSGVIRVDPTTNDIATGVALTVTSGAAVYISGDSTRREIVVQNTGSVDVWVGDSVVSPAAARGIKLIPGAIMVLACNATIFFKTASGSSKISYFSLRRV